MRCFNRKSLLSRKASNPSPLWGRIGGGILLFILLFGCEDGHDDYRYPSVLTDYACLSTDGRGEPSLLRLDSGAEFPIVLTDSYRKTHQSTYRPDTVYRIISIYELGADDAAHIYSIAQIASIVPTPLRKGEILKQDPVYLQSVWLSGGYMNMVLELKALSGQHSIGFVDTTPKEMRGKEFTLYHDAQGDIESYRQKLHASIPLTPFHTDLQQGDTLRLVINLYDKGISQWEFIME